MEYYNNKHYYGYSTIINDNVIDITYNVIDDRVEIIVNNTVKIFNKNNKYIALFGARGFYNILHSIVLQNRLSLINKDNLYYITGTMICDYDDYYDIEFVISK